MQTKFPCTHTVQTACVRQSVPQEDVISCDQGGSVTVKAEVGPTCLPVMETRQKTF